MLVSITTSSFLIIFFLWTTSLFTPTHGHGYVSSPRSRNWVAHEDGIEYKQAGLPRREYCQHCLNRNTGVCGVSPSKNYDDWLDSTGQAMPWVSQAEYNGGDIITIKFVLTTHHGGHAEMRACPNGRASTPECFENYVLEFVSDPMHNMPADPDYPERGYYAGWNTQMRDFEMQFRLPAGLSGDEVLLQWRYITANSCSPPGYEKYYQGGNSQGRTLPSTWYSDSISTCTAYPMDGSVGPGKPEQFFNCMEVTVLPPPPTMSPQPSSAPVTLAPSTSAVPTNSIASRLAPRQDSRMIAYLGNWQSCPTASQLAQYSHVVIAFAVTYTWNPTKNNCNSACQIDTPPVCNNSPNDALIDELHQAGKEVILSFGGAGMGGSWSGDVNDCWEYCYGKEKQVVNQLVKIVEDMNLDGVDIDYEYFYEDNQNGSGFSKGAEAIQFLRDVTVGLRNELPIGSIVTHAPMDVDAVQGTDYYDMLVETSDLLDFLMPQYYNGVTRPVVDGFENQNVGQMATADHYKTLVDEMFKGDATKIVFGFCINACSATGSNANANEAAAVLASVNDAYYCNGGSFFWVVQDDFGGQWSGIVNKAMDKNRGCSGGVDPVGPSPTSSPTLTLAPAASVEPVPTKSPVSGPSQKQCCPSGYSGYRPFNECDQYYRCVFGNIVGVTASCPAGTLFDESLGLCNWENQVSSCRVDSCVPPPAPPTPEPVSPTASPVTPTSSPVSPPTAAPVSPTASPVMQQCCPPGYTGHRPIEDCTLYFKCTNGKLDGTTKSCSAGELFDQDGQECKLANEVTCNPVPCDMLMPPKKDPPSGSSKDDTAKLFNDNDRGNLKRTRRTQSLRGK